MTDRPIIFSAAMVQALLAGRKTQTRRILKPQPGELDRPFCIADGTWHVTDSRGGHMSTLRVPTLWATVSGAGRFLHTAGLSKEITNYLNVIKNMPSHIAPMEIGHLAADEDGIPPSTCPVGPAA